MGFYGGHHHLRCDRAVPSGSFESAPSLPVVDRVCELAADYGVAAELVDVFERRRNDDLVPDDSRVNALPEDGADDRGYL